ncbi:ATP-binding protein [Candidatus Woesearchaeota archaeon]|nr:ATP-binding protein [Candidatus Woesearchaeota archaeon]
MELKKLVEWNPWWEDIASLEKLKGIERESYKEIVKSIAIKEITVILGVRRSGKSTLMYQMIHHLLKKGINAKQILFINLEDIALAKDTLDEIYLCYRENLNQEHKAYIFLDEIQRKEHWESWLRKKYDLKTDDKFVISGSCSYLLRKEYATLLTGRNLTFEIYPLSFKEFLIFKDVYIEQENIKKEIITEKTRTTIINMLKEYIEQGGFPEIVLKEEQYKSKILKQYFDDILYKDIIGRYNLNSQRTKEFAVFLITNITKFISLRNIRNALSFSYDTTKEYLSYYKEAYLFFTTDYFSYSLKEQKIMASKIYTIDSGLRNAVSFRFSQDDGKLVENIVFIELLRKEMHPYYWKGKNEVDFVIKENDQMITAINVTYSDEIEEREVKALQEFKNNFKKVKKAIIITKNLEKQQDDIYFIPLWKWLLIGKDEIIPK